MPFSFVPPCKRLFRFDDDVLREYLIWNRPNGKFNENVVGDFIARLKATITYANLAAGDKIENDGDDDTGDDENGDDSEQELEVQPKKKGKGVSAVAGNSGAGAVVRDFPIPLMGGGVAVIKVPVPMSEIDFAQITGTLNAWKSALVSKPANNDEGDADGDE